MRNRFASSTSSAKRLLPSIWNNDTLVRRRKHKHTRNGSRRLLHAGVGASSIHKEWENEKCRNHTLNNLARRSSIMPSFLIKDHIINVITIEYDVKPIEQIKKASLTQGAVQRSAGVRGKGHWANPNICSRQHVAPLHNSSFNQQPEACHIGKRMVGVTSMAEWSSLCDPLRLISFSLLVTFGILSYSPGCRLQNLIDEVSWWHVFDKYFWSTLDFLGATEQCDIIINVTLDSHKALFLYWVRRALYAYRTPRIQFHSAFRL